MDIESFGGAKRIDDPEKAEEMAHASDKSRDKIKLFKDEERKIFDLKIERLSKMLKSGVDYAEEVSRISYEFNRLPNDKEQRTKELDRLILEAQVIEGVRVMGSISVVGDDKRKLQALTKQMNDDFVKLGNTPKIIFEDMDYLRR